MRAIFPFLLSAVAELMKSGGPGPHGGPGAPETRWRYNEQTEGMFKVQLRLLLIVNQ